MITSKLETLLQEEIENIKKSLTPDYTFEKNKLKSLLGEGLYANLKKHNLMVAGGTITSLFTGRDVNDIDVYAKNNENMLKFFEDVCSRGTFFVSHTDRATMFMYDELPVQLIHYREFKTAEDIFDSYDFTVCSGLFDFSTEEFILHPDFMKHNSQRILKFNPNTAFPITSLLRVKKYEEKGYKISKTEMVRIALTCMKLEINSYDELKSQIGGQYGADYKRMFEDLDDDGEFSLEKAIEYLSTLSLSEDYFKELNSSCEASFEEILEDIDKSEKVVFHLDGEAYRTYTDGSFSQVTSNITSDVKIDYKDFFKDKKLYKFVHKDGEDLRSYFRPSYRYEIGREAVPATPHQSGGHVLYFNTKDKITESHYYNEHNNVLLEASFDVDDLVGIGNGDSIKVKKVFVERIVPEEEWKGWVSDDENVPGGILF